MQCAVIDTCMHAPQVLWTWYACVMVVFNIAKGAALAITRIVYMILLNFCQFSIVDKTVFPQGTEGMDPAYASFIGTVHYACKYRNPIVTSLFLRFFEEREAAQVHTTIDTDERGLEEVGDTPSSRNGNGNRNERAVSRGSQDSGCIMSHGPNPNRVLSSMVWDQSGSSTPHPHGLPRPSYHLSPRLTATVPTQGDWQ